MLPVSWILAPLLLLLLCAGCGLLVGALADRPIPPALVGVCGFALIAVAGQLTTLTDATAELTTPLVVALALAGLALNLKGSGTPRIESAVWWGISAGAAVFAVYAAPIVLSGEPTIAGFIKLDDTATWLALTDRIADHGRDLGGLAPSSYEATLAFNLGDGYPVGVFVPLAVAAELTGYDPAWLIAPYMAVLAVLLAGGLWAIGRTLVTSNAALAACVFVAAQPALLYGYYLWGGVKEIAAAALAVGAAAFASRLAEPVARRALLVPLVVLGAATVAVLSAGGLAWFVPALLGGLAIAGHRHGPRAAGRDAGLIGAGVLVLGVPAILAGSLIPPTSSPLTDSQARGNLIEPLSAAQGAGIWPAGDFRLPPGHELLAYGLIAAALALALAGLAWAWRRRAHALLVYVGATLAAGGAVYLFGSPWVAAKALATISPAIPLAAMIGAVWLLSRPLRAVGAAALAAIAGGVIWSNALGYRDAVLAPHGQLAELERIGELTAGEGPALMTEYEPYGVRHFLREADPEGVSELRRRTIPLLDGSLVPKGESADTDAIDPAALGFYRTLVLRRSPVQSRPPASYDLAWSGHYYEAWQRGEAAAVPERIGLGGPRDPVGVPRCGAVLALAESGDLIAARRPRPLVTAPADADYPESWEQPGAAAAPVPRGPGTLAARVGVPAAGRYTVWLGGSLKPATALSVDGRPAGEVGGEVNNRGGYVELGAAELSRGEHLVEVEVDGAGLAPGRGGDLGPIGPLALTRGTAADAELVRVPAARARSLCGRSWDWIEVAG